MNSGEVNKTKNSMENRLNIGDILSNYGVLIAFLLIFVALSIFTNTFFTVPNMLNVVRQVSVNGIIAVGIMFVLLTGGIDLSVGSIVALSGVVAAQIAQYPENHWSFAVLLGLLMGAGIGVVNGFIIVKVKVVPFVATLGMMGAARGLALVLSGGRPISRLSDPFRQIGGGVIFGFLPILSIIMLLCFVIGYIVLNRTKFGRYVYAIGGNEKAARVSGLKVDQIKFLVYVISATFAALAGIVLASRINAGSPVSGDGFELDAIAAVVIGGTSLSGGVGKIWGTLLGVMMVGMINNGLDLLNVSSYYQLIIKGAIIVLAVAIDMNVKRR